MNVNRKFQILEILNKAGEITAQEVYESLKNEVKKTTVYDLLRRYHVQGLVKREKRLGIYVYSLTKKGKERLYYFKRRKGGLGISRG